MSDVFVLGVDMMKFGRFPEKTVPQLGGEAALMALDDAGLTIQQMQAVYCGNIGESNAMVGQRILHQIGQTGVPVVNCANACATGATAFREAWIAIKAGLYDLVLAVGVEQMGREHEIVEPGLDRDPRLAKCGRRRADGPRPSGRRLQGQRCFDGRSTRLGHDARGVR
jgi:acetyl-CoA acetyltransferase